MDNTVIQDDISKLMIGETNLSPQRSMSELYPPVQNRNFISLLTKTYVVGTQKNHLNETVL